MLLFASLVVLCLKNKANDVLFIKKDLKLLSKIEVFGQQQLSGEENIDCTVAARAYDKWKRERQLFSDFVNQHFE